MVDIVFLGLNQYGESVYDWLTDQEESNVLALLTERNQLSVVQKLEPELIISGGFRHIVPADILTIPSIGAVNLHHSFLPYNRGGNPEIWSILEEPPAGVSVHWMTEDVDAGNIIARQQVATSPADTGRNLYDRLIDRLVSLFKETWPQIRDGKVDAAPQDTNQATFHRRKEFVDIWEIDNNDTVRAGDLIDRLRALTFPPYWNAYTSIDGERYYYRLQCVHESEINEENTIHWNIPTSAEEEY